MNKIVLIALRRPYTFVVLSILIVIFGIRAIRHSPTDVFPTIKIPVISVVWAYAGMLPLDVSGRITFYFERFLTSTGVLWHQHHQYFSSAPHQPPWRRSGSHSHSPDDCQGAAAGYFAAHDHASRAILYTGGHAPNQLRQADARGAL